VVGAARGSGAAAECIMKSRGEHVYMYTTRNQAEDTREEEQEEEEDEEVGAE
jgi:hypothetical protein